MDELYSKEIKIYSIVYNYDYKLGIANRLKYIICITAINFVSI